VVANKRRSGIEGARRLTEAVPIGIGQILSRV